MSDKFLTPIISTKSLIGYVLLKSALYTEHKQKGYTFTRIKVFYSYFYRN